MIQALANYRPRLWHVTAAVSAGLITAGLLMSSEVCTAAPSPKPPAPSASSVLDNINTWIDNNLILDELKPTTTVPTPTTTPRSDPSTWVPVVANPDDLSGEMGRIAATMTCKLPDAASHETQILVPPDKAECLVQTGHYVRPTAANTPKVCSTKHPAVLWYGVALALLTLILGWLRWRDWSYEPRRYTPRSTFAVDDDYEPPPPPPPPVFDPSVKQRGRTPPPPTNFSHDDDEDF
ncbi:MAG: hypothetical protein KDB26_15265 [Microthrixaceae bacterium]|nr:hypothetical protein [Microthrixaceae bacterium]